MYALTQYQIEKNRVSSLNTECGALERQIEALAKSYGSNHIAFENRSEIMSKDMTSFKNANPKSESIMDTWGNPDRTYHSTDVSKYHSQMQDYQIVLAKELSGLRDHFETKKVTAEIQKMGSEISAIQEYLGDESKLPAFDRKSLNELQAIFRDLSSKLPELRKLKQEKIKHDIEEEIQKHSAKFDTSTNERFFSKPASVNRKFVERRGFNLFENKELVKSKLSKIKDQSFYENYVDKLGSIESQVTYKAWLSTVNTKILEESLIDSSRQTQEYLKPLLPKLPDGPTKNTLQYEVDNLDKRDSWGKDQDKWNEVIGDKITLLSNYINEEVQSQDDKNYVIDSILEVFASRGIILDSRNYIDGQSMNVVSGTTGNVSSTEEFDQVERKQTIEDLVKMSDKRRKTIKQEEFMRQQRLNQARQMARVI
jgi:hypothetical protein